MAEQRYCSKCRKTMAETNFYTYKDGTKCELCKACLTLHINNFEPDTYMWLLEKFDLPYLPWEWNTLRDRAYQKDPYKMNGMSVFGKYLSKMKLKQYVDPVTKKPYGFADSARLQEEHDAKAKLYGQPEEIAAKQLAEMEEAYKNGEITEAQWMTYKEIKAPEPEFQVINGNTVTTAGPGGSPYPVNDNPFEQVDVSDVGNDLTEEDKVYLAMKWGRLYSASDWVLLEQMYKSYEESFDLHNADLINGTKQLCKLDLKGNLALDSGDFDSYSKIARASDSLRKSLKFTEAQRKEDKTSEFSCYGQIVAFAEKNNDEDYIRPINLNIDRDIVDADIRDIKNFTKTLIEEDPAVFKMIEQYIKKRENLQSQEEIDATEDFELSDEDFKDFADAIEEQRKQDNLLDDEEEDEE